MTTKIRTALPLFLLAAALLACLACQPAARPEGTPDAAAAEDSAQEVTGAQAAEALPDPTTTPEPTRAPTPTIPPGWFEGMGVLESDYLYYDALLIKAEDPLTLVSVAQDYGVSMVECPTCDLVAGKFISVTHAATGEQYMVSDFLFRFLDPAGLEAALQEVVSLIGQNGVAPTGLPQGTDLPQGTLFFKTPIITAVIVPYGLFEVRLIQEGQNALSTEENAAVILELAELQLAKLRSAGY